MGFVTTFPVEGLRVFVGTREEAVKLAMEDMDQYEVDIILAWGGDPSLRTTMEFEVKFKNGSIVWKPWDRDLALCQPFEDYCTVDVTESYTCCCTPQTKSPGQRQLSLPNLLLTCNQGT